MAKLFRSKKRIRLGVWGLGRGRAFYDSLRSLQFDIVAGCDFNEKMRTHFLGQNPGATATADAEIFLKGDFDAVLLATFCPGHGPDAVRCLEAGKHVLSEVTAFHTLAEGVRLVEAVEKSGLVYNLAENYPFSAPNMYLHKLWQDGLFGEFMYGEYEYVHEIAALSYSYITGESIQPGHTLHNWRSWLNFHYYNTHSLGPVMHITGARPTRVTALPSEVSFPGLPRFSWLGQPTPSLVKMSNGGLVRNFMGHTAHDTHLQRLYGTLGGAEVEGWDRLKFRLGGRGLSPMAEVRPEWAEHGQLARQFGHGGGDFWVCYHFARHILDGVEAPFAIHRAADCTLQGIMAYRSMSENGRPFDIPDFRQAAARKKWKNDHFAQPRWDTAAGLFPEGADTEKLADFNSLMLKLLSFSSQYRAWRSWELLREDVIDARPLAEVASGLLRVLPEYRKTIRQARRMVGMYQDSLGATALTDVLDVVGDSSHVLRRSLDQELRTSAQRMKSHLRKNREESALNTLKDALVSPFVRSWKTAWREHAAGKVSEIAFGPSARLREDREGVIFALPARAATGRAGFFYFQTTLRVSHSGKWELRLGHDAPVTVFLDGRRIAESPKPEVVPAADRLRCEVSLKKGTAHEFVAVIDAGIHELANCVSLRLTPSRPRPVAAVPA